MRRLVATAGATLIALAGGLAVAPGANAGGIAGYGMSALAVGVRYQLNSPGFLPTGDPAEGNIIELDVPIARSLISGGPLINALASPAYPGDTAAHLGTALGILAPPEFPKLPNDPIVAEANYPPTPEHGSTASFGQNGIGEGTAQASATGTKVVAHSIAQSIEGVIDVGSSTSRNDVTIAASSVRSIATSTTTGITIAGLITIDGVTGRVEAVSDGVSATPSAQLQIGKVTVAGQAAYIDRDGVHLATAPGVGDGVIAGLQTLVNATLATDGITIRTIAPRTTVDKAAATATAGALAITIERTIPAVSVPGFPALEVPGQAPIILGTPELPTHIDVLIGEARVGVNATSLLPFDDVDLGAPLAPVVSGDTTISGDDFTSVTGPGASLNGALAPSLQEGEGELGLPASSERGTGRGIPVGWVIVGIFGAFVISGPLLGYARWQLLEGRHR
jgi:hypothetical protein